MYKYNWEQRLPFVQFSGNIQHANPLEKSYANYEHFKGNSQTAMYQSQTRACSDQLSGILKYDQNSFGNCSIRQHAFVSDQYDTKHSVSAIPEKTNDMKQEENFKSSLKLKQKLEILAKDVVKVEKNVSIMKKNPAPKHFDKNSINNGSEIEINELGKTTHGILKGSKVNSVDTKDKKVIWKDTEESQDKVDSKQSYSQCETQKGKSTSMCNKPMLQTDMKEKKKDGGMKGITKKKSKLKNKKTDTKVNLLEKKSLGYTAPGDKKIGSCFTNKTSSQTERICNKELFMAGGNKLQKTVIDAVSEKIHELKERSNARMYKNEKQDSVKPRSDYMFNKDRSYLSTCNSMEDKYNYKGTSIINTVDILKSDSSKNSSDDRAVMVLSQPVVNVSPVTALDTCMQSMTSFGHTEKKKQDTELMKNGPCFALAQVYKDFSLPEHNKSTHQMKISDRTLTTPSSLPDLETFGRKVQKTSSEKQQNLDPMPSSFDGSSSCITNASSVQQLSKTYWEDVFTKSNCYYQNKNSSTQQHIPCNQSLVVNNSSGACNSGHVNESLKSRDVGKNSSEANSGKHSSQAVSQKYQQYLTEKQYKACPVVTISSDENDFEDGDQCQGQHVSLGSYDDVSGMVEKVHNLTEKQAGISSEHGGCTRFNEYLQSNHLNPSSNNTSRCNQDMSYHGANIFDTSCEMKSLNELTCGTHCSFTQQKQYLDKNTTPNHKQEHSFVKQKFMDFNQKNSLNATNSGKQGTGSFYMKSEIIQQKTSNKYLNERHDVRTCYTNNMDSSWYGRPSQQYWNNIPRNRNQVFHGMNINVFPTIIAMPSNKSPSEPKVETDNYFTAITKGESNRTVDVKTKEKVDNKIGNENLPVLYDVQNELDEISKPADLEFEKSERNATIASDDSEASLDNPDIGLELIGDETQENVHKHDDTGENIMSKDDFVEISELAKISVAVSNKKTESVENTSEQDQSSKNSLDFCTSSNDTRSDVNVGSKISEKYKYPMVLMSPLKMTKKLEDMIDNCIARSKVDSPVISLIQSPSISVQTPITPMNSPTITSADFSPPLLSPIGLSTLTGKMPFDTDFKESCIQVKKSKKKRRSRSKVLKDLVRHYEREKSLVEDAENFLGADFSKTSARKRKLKTDVNSKERSKKPKIDIKDVLKDDQELQLVKRSKNSGRKTALFHINFKDKEADKTGIDDDKVNDNASGLVKQVCYHKTFFENKTYDKSDKKSVGDIEEEQKLPLIQQLHKKRKDGLKFSIKIKKDADEKGEKFEIKNIIESKVSDGKQKEKSMKKQKHKKKGAHYEKYEKCKLTRRYNELLDGEIDENRDSNVECTKTYEIPHKKRLCNNFNVINTNEEKRIGEKMATKEIDPVMQKELNLDESLAFRNDQKLILQTLCKKKSKSKDHKIFKEASDSMSADLRMPLGIDERDEVELTNNVNEVKIVNRVKDAKATDKTDRKNKTKEPTAPRKYKKKLKDSTEKKKKREVLNLKESDKMANHVSNKMIKTELRKCTMDNVGEETEVSLNVLNKKRKLRNKIGTEKMESSIDNIKWTENDKSNKLCGDVVDKPGKMHSDEVDKGKKLTQEKSIVDATKKMKARKRSTGQDDLLQVISSKVKSKKRKVQKLEDSGSDMVCLKELKKQDLAKETDHEITGSGLGSTKKGALKSRKIVSDHLKKYKKESIEKKGSGSKCKKLAVKKDGQVFCQICNEQFETRKHRHCHTLICHPYRCTWCKLEFGDKETSRVHYFTHIKKTYQCDLCDMKYGNPISYKQHMKSTRHKKALKDAGFSSDVETFGQDSCMQDGLLTVENMEKHDNHQSVEDNMIQFHSSSQQMSLFDSDNSSNDTGLPYYQTEACNSTLLPSYAAYPTRQNTNIFNIDHNMNENFALDGTLVQEVLLMKGSYTNEDLMETSSVVYDNGKVYTEMTDVRGGTVGNIDTHGSEVWGFENASGIEGYPKVQDEDMIYSDQVEESSLLCRIVNSFSLAK